MKCTKCDKLGHPARLCSNQARESSSAETTSADSNVKTKKTKTLVDKFKSVMT